MVLKKQELLQIDEKFIQNLLKKDPDALVSLSIKLSNDLKEAVERLNQNPSNSSKPSGSLAPWEKNASDSTDEFELEAEPMPPEEDNKENSDHEKPNKNKNDQP